LLSGHYVEADDNLVLLIRSFDRGSFFSIDDEGYEKLSIEIKSYRIGEPIYLNSPDISFYYSRGSSAFINKGHGVYSASGSGEIIIKRKEKNRLIVKIDLSLNAEPAGAYPFEAEKVEIKGEYIFIEKQVSELTPWLGMPDPSLGKEVYP